MFSKITGTLSKPDSASQSQSAMYRYEIKDIEGKSVKGQLKAKNLKDALRTLEKRSATVVSLEKVSRAPAFKAGNIKGDELLFIFRELSVLIECGIPLTRALTVMIGQEKDSAVKELLSSMQVSVEKGESFSLSMSRYPETFSRFHISLIKAGEAGGFIGRSLAYLASVLEKESNLKKRVRASLNYPLVIFIFGIAISLGAFFMIYPYVKMVVRDLGVNLPLYSRAMMAVIDWLESPYIFVPLLFATFYVMVKLKSILSSTVHGRMWKEKLSLSIPCLRDIVKKTILTRILFVMEALLASGVNLINALELAADCCENLIVEHALKSVVSRIRDGESMAEGMESYPSLFPRTVISMISVGEQSGNLAELFRKTATLYTMELTATLESFVRLVEPLAIVTIGTIVTVMILSFFVPIYMALSKF